MACTLYPFNRIFIFKGQTKEATDSLKFLRGKSEEGVQGELILIQVKRIFSKKTLYLTLSFFTHTRRQLKKHKKIKATSKIFSTPRAI
jgi:hypothetical protein